MKFDFERSLSRSDALRAMIDAWNVEPNTEIVALDKAYGRVLAQDVYALYNLPVKRSSRLDGIAVHSRDFADGLPDTSNWVRDVDFAQADTGDDFSDEFDAVIAIECVRYDEGGKISLTEDKKRISIEPGAGINPSGAIVEAGSLVVEANTRLTPELVAACAMAGHAQLPVLGRPKVAFLPTGTELVPWGTAPQRGQNIEANSLMVRGLLEEWGAECMCYPVTKDEPELLEKALDRALAWADIVIINGGSSRGEEDYNSQMLERRASYFCHGVRAVPGRPVGMAVIDNCPVVNVPGPVMAAFLCMDWLIRGLVAHYQGVPVPQHQVVRARVSKDVKTRAGFERITRVTLAEGEDGALVCTPISKIGVPRQIATTDAFLVLPATCEGVSAGDEVEVQLLRPLELIRASW